MLALTIFASCGALIPGTEKSMAFPKICIEFRATLRLFRRKYSLVSLDLNPECTFTSKASIFSEHKEQTFKKSFNTVASNFLISLVRQSFKK